MNGKQICFWVAVEMALSFGLTNFSSESGLNFEYGDNPISSRELANDEMVSVVVCDDKMVVVGDNVNGCFKNV